MNWFEGKGYRPTEAYQNAGGYPTQANPTLATQGDPYGGAQPNLTQPCALPSGEQIYDARTGELVTSGADPYAAPPGEHEGAVYAGIAYEVHALSIDGNSTPINPATHVFHTGDKFMVYYRPSLPGRMEVYNINPAGQPTWIQTTNMAAGELTGLGPYQFARLTGDESLRLVLSPCSNPQLLVATRDIVLVNAGPETMAQADQTSGGFQLTSCDEPTTRDLEVRTRDIEMVAVDEMTAFSLDPVSQQERDSGQVAPRETTIVFHHR